MSALPVGTVATQQYGSGTKVSSLAAATTRAVAAGHSLVVFVTLEGSGGVTAVLSGTDTRGNTYTAGPKLSDGTTRTIYTLTAPVTNALSLGDSITISAVDPGTSLPYTRGRWNIVVEEVSGLVAAAVDQTSTGTGTGNSLDAGTTGSTTQADEIIYAGYSIGPALTLTTPGSGYSAGGTSTTTAGSNEHRLVTQYKVLSATGTQHATGTLSGTGGSVGASITLKAVTTVDTAANAASGTGWVLTGASATVALGDADNTTYYTSADNPSGTNPLRVDFATPSTPPVSGQTVTWTLRLWSVGATTASAVVKVYTGSAVLQRTFSTTTLSGTPTDYVYTLTDAERAAITSADGTWAGVYCEITPTAAP